MKRRLGAFLTDDRGCVFTVWALSVSTVDVHILYPEERIVRMEKLDSGYFSVHVPNVSEGCRYYYRLDGGMERPDPASRFQPEGVHGPSQVIREPYDWKDEGWFGLPLDAYVVYELHVGTFTGEGTFDAAVFLLDGLKDLGVTAVELMPVAQFPGDRNWGYDGVFPFAVQNSYGGPAAFKRFVEACHQRELAVILDVVYNHLGPEGNYLREYAPYFTNRYGTPWGEAINFDGPDSDEVRHFFIENALYWTVDFHVDALRLDAVHAIFDFSAHTFLEELAESVRAAKPFSGRPALLMAESNRNDVRLVAPVECGGYGLDAVWNDDLHHSLHALLTGERSGYYMDFGELRQLAKAYLEGFVYSGEYSRFRRRRHGTSSGSIPGGRFVVCAQNHDQVGNRMLGERLPSLVSFEALKLAAAAVMLTPCIPLLFMGEEYGETAPFQYFISHSDRDLIEAVRKGRRAEFDSFAWEGKTPDPQSVEVFSRCKLRHHLKNEMPHDVLYRYYRKVLQWRKRLNRNGLLQKNTLRITEYPEIMVLCLRYRTKTEEAAAVFNFGSDTASFSWGPLSVRCNKVLDSSDSEWNGPGSLTDETMEGTGEVQCRIAAHTCALFHGREGSL